MHKGIAGKWLGALVTAACLAGGCETPTPNDVYIETPAQGAAVPSSSVFALIRAHPGILNGFNHVYYSVDSGPQQELTEFYEGALTCPLRWYPLV